MVTVSTMGALEQRSVTGPGAYFSCRLDGSVSCIAKNRFPSPTAAVQVTLPDLAGVAGASARLWGARRSGGSRWVSKAPEPQGCSPFPSRLQYFHKTVGQLLPLAYSLLKRSLFADIIQSHLANRRQEEVDQLVP